MKKNKFQIALALFLVLAFNYILVTSCDSGAIPGPGIDIPRHNPGSRSGTVSCPGTGIILSLALVYTLILTVSAELALFPALSLAFIPAYHS